MAIVLLLIFLVVDTKVMIKLLRSISEGYSETRKERTYQKYVSKDFPQVQLTPSFLTFQTMKIIR